MKSGLNILLVGALLLLAGCGAWARVGKDAAVVVTAPVTIPVSAVYDSLQWEEDSSSAAPVLLLPLNFFLHAGKHFGYSLVYFADVFAAPFYLVASIDPDNSLEPIDLYRFDGYPWNSEPIPYIEE